MYAFWFVLFFVLAIALIENDGTTFLVEMAGDVFGSFVLMIMGMIIYHEAEDEEEEEEE